MMRLQNIISNKLSIVLFLAMFFLIMPLIAAAQGKIAFTSVRDGNYEIYVMDGDGSNQIRLTNNTAKDDQPAFSPDGSKIAFVSERDGNEEIYIMNADGTNQMRLTNNSASDSEPTFSGDGSKIAFQTNRDGNLEVYLMNADGTNQINLTNNPGSQPALSGDGTPSFNPVTNQIAFYSTRNSDSNSNLSDLYVMNMNGSNVTRLTNAPGDDAFPSFSPDGTKIAFTSTRDNTFEVYVMNANGSNQTRLTNVSVNTNPSFSPDGSKIAFGSARDGDREIYVMNVNGSDQNRLTDNQWFDDNPSWSVQANSAPMITAFGAMIARDSSASGVSIASVNDAEDAENDLSVTVNGGSSATVNNVTISNIVVGSTGNVTADISTTCGAANASFTLRVTDSGGLFAEATLNVTVTNETTAPTLILPADIVTSLPLNSTDTSKIVNFAVSANDNCDANPTVTAEPASGSAFPVGTTTVNVTATDASGNTATGSFTVTVLYNFAGFFQPIENLPVVNIVKAGQSVPVKFSLSGNKGLNIFAPGFPASQPIACTSGLPSSSVEETSTAGSSSLSYDATTDQYIYVWKTEKAWKGTCRQLIVKLNDGSLHIAYFQFK